MARRERDVLERAAHAVAEQAAKVDRVVAEALDAGLDGSAPVTVAAKTVRIELLSVKAELERQLGRLVLHCRECGRQVHWVDEAVLRACEQVGAGRSRV